MKRIITRRSLKSYVAGDSRGFTLTGATLPDQLRATVEKFSESNAITEVAKQRSFTFGQLEAHTNALAANLISLGLEEGLSVSITFIAFIRVR